MIPQLIFISLSLVGIGLTIREHSNPRTEKYNAFSTIIGTVLVQLLYYWGGFWDQLEWPQWIMIFLIGVTVINTVAQHGNIKSKSPILITILGTVVSLIILYFGHFFDPLLKLLS